MEEFVIDNYKVQSNGHDGGRKYIISKIIYKGIERRLIILFESKTEESKLSEINNNLSVKGNLIDEGIKQDLMLLDSKII